MVYIFAIKTSYIFPDLIHNIFLLIGIQISIQLAFMIQFIWFYYKSLVDMLNIFFIFL